MIGVRWARHKPQVSVPVPRFVVLGMDKKCPNSDDFGSGRSFFQRILDECLSQAAPLLALVDSKTGKENYGHRIPPQPLANPLGRVGVFHCSRRETVVGDYLR